MTIVYEVVACPGREVKTSVRRPVPRVSSVQASVPLLFFLLASSGCDDSRDAHADEGFTSAASSLSSAVPPIASAPPAPSALYEAEELARMDEIGATLVEQREALVDRMKKGGVIDDGQGRAILELLSASKMTGQGNPEPTKHPMTRAECFERRRAAGVRDEREPRCGAPYMVPVYDPERQTKNDAPVCIDRYEFPGLPCEYPVTWVSTSQAQKICKVMGKRLCDAHEWEGACAGDLREPKEEYSFGFPRAGSSNFHNGKRPISWAYGPKKDHARCATESPKSPKCTASGWKECGSNTYPTGAFPACKSAFGVYDQHGNAAEHMLLPLEEKELGSRGGAGVAEMKGSWFIFSIKEAHVDDCRWRAPPWHENEGMNHANYHLGFRCCKDVGG
jgi:formylglycine-generating enzyme required for sulfatase activity